MLLDWLQKAPRSALVLLCLACAVLERADAQITLQLLGERLMQLAADPALESRGFAFIEFATPEEASKAVEQFHNQEFQGRALTVNVAKPREERAPRYSGDRPGAGEARV